MTATEITNIVAEIGAPICVPTDDGELTYWKFSDSDIYAADSIGELLEAAIGVCEFSPWGRR